MTPLRFADLAAAYGADIRNWPHGSREQARALLRGQPDLQDLLDSQRGLDTRLKAWTVSDPAAALTGRIIDALAARHARTKRWRLWLSGLATATALAGGVAAAAIFMTTQVPAQEDGVSQLYQLTVLGAPLEPDTQTTMPGPAS